MEGSSHTPLMTDVTPREALSVKRFFTTPGVHPFETVEWELRDARIGHGERQDSVANQHRQGLEMFGGTVVHPGSGPADVEVCSASRAAQYRPRVTSRSSAQHRTGERSTARGAVVAVSEISAVEAACQHRQTGNRESADLPFRELLELRYCTPLPAHIGMDVREQGFRTDEAVIVGFGDSLTIYVNLNRNLSFDLVTAMALVVPLLVLTVITTVVFFRSVFRRTLKI